MKKLLLVLTALAILPVGLANAQVFVRVAPPPAVVERRPAPPDVRYVWIPGYHRWDGRAYIWEPGRYVLPPHPHAVWVAGRWEHRGEGYVWIAGRWR